VPFLVTPLPPHDIETHVMGDEVDAEPGE